MRRTVLILLLILGIFSSAYSAMVSTRVDMIRHFSINYETEKNYIFGIGTLSTLNYTYFSANIGKRFYMKAHPASFFEVTLGYEMNHHLYYDYEDHAYLNINAGGRKTFYHFFITPYIGYVTAYGTNGFEIFPIAGFEVGIDF